MTRARRELIDPSVTTYYHVIGRCVRRAFLCGEDKFTGKNFDHRKQWVLDRLSELTRVFTIDVCAYAVMSNHYHIVVRLNPEKAQRLNDKQVIRRWHRFYSLPLLVERYLKGGITKAEEKAAKVIIEQWRKRLSDLSWFMRNLNEYLARRANEEDQCKGRFWEGRFKSQALLDEAAVLTCMSYVDLNPVRAGIAKTPEESDFTSIQQRIHDWQKKQTKRKDKNALSSIVPLMPLVKQNKDPHVQAIGFSVRDYFELVDWAGRAIRADKRGAIPPDTPPILQRLKLNHDAYLRHVTGKNKLTLHIPVMGSVERLQQLGDQLQQRFVKGVGMARQLYQHRAQ